MKDDRRLADRAKQIEREAECDEARKIFEQMCDEINAFRVLSRYFEDGTSPSEYHLVLEAWETISTKLVEDLLL